jgi:hypothetical protein
MRHLFYLVVLAIGLSGPLRADEGAVKAVISAQIEAFLANDVERAWEFASPTIQQRFGSSERFGTMVREGYPMVWRPSDVTFLDSQVIAGKLWQNVLVRDAGGAPYVVEYQMIENEDGWKINAVRVRQAPAGTV